MHVQYVHTAHLALMQTSKRENRQVYVAYMLLASWLILSLQLRGVESRVDQKKTVV